MVLSGTEGKRRTTATPTTAMVMSCEPSRMPMRMRWMRKVLKVREEECRHVDRMSLNTSMRNTVRSRIRHSSRK